MLTEKEIYMKQIIKITLLFIIIIWLLGCGGKGKSIEAQDPVLSKGSAEVSTIISPSRLKGLHAGEALALANQWKTEAPYVTSFVTPEEVSFKFDDGEMVNIPIESEKMVVAVAPYINETHPCETHYMSGCQGELINVPVDVVVKSKDGTVIINESMKTMTNGFVELWLPRDMELGVIIESKGLRSDGTISTYSSSNTCVTTFKLL